MVRVNCQNGEGGGSWVGQEVYDTFFLEDLCGGATFVLIPAGQEIFDVHQDMGHSMLLVQGPRGLYIDGVQASALPPQDIASLKILCSALKKPSNVHNSGVQSSAFFVD